jgi:virulence-associated protein VapD
MNYDKCVNNKFSLEENEARHRRKLKKLYDEWAQIESDVRVELEQLRFNDVTSRVAYERVWLKRVDVVITIQHHIKIIELFLRNLFPALYDVRNAEIEEQKARDQLNEYLESQDKSQR